MNLSIIIPIFNVERDLEFCLQSLTVQIDNDSDSLVEIILINDGSTDSSGNIAEKFAEKYGYISYFSQDNQGLSAARNFGFDKAVGKYVWFVDSDDWISSNGIELITERIIGHSADIIMIGLAEYLEKKLIKQFLPHNYSDGISILKTDNYFVGAVVYVMKRSFLKNNKLKFYRGIYHEDEEFVNRMLYYAKSVLTLDSIIYCVNVRDGSITRSFNPKKSFDLLVVIMELNNFMITVGERDLYYRRIGLLFNNALYNICGATKTDIVLFEKLYAEKYSFIKKYLLTSNKLAYKIEGVLLHIPFIRPTSVYKFLTIFK